MKQNLEVKGFFLSFTDEETAFLREELEAAGYELTPQGIKDYLIESFQDHDEQEKGAADQVIDKIKKAVIDNPETVKMYTRLAGGALTSILSKMKKAGH